MDGLTTNDQLGFERRDIMRGALAAAIAGAVAPAPLFARTATRYAALEAFVQRYVSEKRISGACAVIVRPGRFRPDFVSFGSTDFEGGKPVDKDTLWRCYSMTKPITGAAVMQHVEKGLLGIDTPVGDLLPEYRSMQVAVDPTKGLEARPAQNAMLVRHLLTHMAGLSYSIQGDGPIEREYVRLGLLPLGQLGKILTPEGDPVDLETFVTRLATVPLWSEPGSAFRYSVGLDLAGGMLQRITRTPYDRLLEQTILGPLGMKDTGFTVPQRSLGRMSSLYVWLDPKTRKPTETPFRADNGPTTAYAHPPSMPAGGAGLVSSAENYARFAQMLLNDGMFEGRRLMQPATARRATSNLMPNGRFYETAGGYGAGGSVSLFDTSATPEGDFTGVYGWSGAAGTLFHIDPVRQIGAALMLQYMPAPRYPTSVDFTRALHTDIQGGSTFRADSL